MGSGIARHEPVRMLVPLATALVLSMVYQSPSTDQSLAEQLARSGQTVEALGLFEQIVALNPANHEARLWVARLQLGSDERRMPRPGSALSFSNVHQISTRALVSAPH
jgi:hypothetical protein